VPPSLPFWIGEGPRAARAVGAAIATVRTHGHDPAWLARECGPARPRPSSSPATCGTAATHSAWCRPTTSSCSSASSTRAAAAAGAAQPVRQRASIARSASRCASASAGFGFELQAAADEDAILISLGPDAQLPAGRGLRTYLHPNTAHDVLVQALLAAPMFEARWRWNVTRSLLVERFRSGGRVCPPLCASAPTTR
jgi:ATP-dependent Lhr-like helicase